MTFDFPEDLLKEVKIRAVQEGKTFKTLMAELLDQGLDILELERLAQIEKASQPDEDND